MDQQAVAAINSLANAIATNSSPVSFVAMIVVLIIVSASASFGGAYLRRRGENLATKADLDVLKEQLATTTRIAEQIKSEIGLEDWKTREAHSLRRTQIERAYGELAEAEAKLHAWWTEQVANNDVVARDDSSLSRLESIIGLYFPNLTPEMRDYGTLHRLWVSEGYAVARELPHQTTSVSDLEAHGRGLQRADAYFRENYPRRLTSKTNLETALKREMHALLPPTLVLVPAS